MGIETERRFLVDPEKAGAITSAAMPRKRIEQGYLFPDVSRQVRIRTVNGSSAFLTIKGPKVNGSGLEFEYPVPYPDAVGMLDMLAQLHIRKTRYEIPHGAFLIELDIFDPINGTPLAIAEIETDDIDQPLDVPDWFGPEITGDERFSNIGIAIDPPSRTEIDALLA